MVHYLIIDASGFTHMDQMGVMSFKDLAEEMAKKRIEVLITSCRGMYFHVNLCFYSFSSSFHKLSHRILS
uniref:STAS domain-containing protein n=1 Tax=Parascaris equorum TaxID=6256 RepID=A0A914RM51_PAREQ